MKLETLEDINAITLEDLQSPLNNEWTDATFRMAWSAEMSAAYELRLSTLAPEVEILINEIKDRLKENLSTDETFDKIRQLPPKLLLRAWTRLTAQGPADPGYELAKLVHKNLAWNILELFESPSAAD